MFKKSEFNFKNAIYEVEQNLIENQHEEYFGVESFDFDTGNGYIYPRGNGYGNIAKYFPRKFLEEYLKYLKKGKNVYPYWLL